MSEQIFAWGIANIRQTGFSPCSSCDGEARSAKRIPFWNGEPCPEDHFEISGWKRVCDDCYREWLELDEGAKEVLDATI